MQTAQAIEKLESLCAAYCETAGQLEHSRRSLEGMFGLPGGPTKDPCHKRFLEDAAALLREFAEGRQDSSGARELLGFLFAYPKRTAAPKTAYWTLIAAQGQVRELIARLSGEDAAALAADYQALYPRRERLPVQDEILKLLQRAAK